MLKRKENPFKDIVNLFSDKPLLLTLPVLDSIKLLLQPYIQLKTYSQCYDILTFLAENNALIIVTNTDGSHSITNPHYVKSN